MRSADDSFLDGIGPAGFVLLDFWQWSNSDLLTNTTRGVLAEFIVAKALGVSDKPRIAWDAFDLLTSSGVPVEVKSCAYIQSWEQKKPSSISFVIRKTKRLDPAKGAYAGDPRRQAAIYVFAVLSHQDRETVNPMDLEQWDFYCVLTSVLDARTRSQHSLTLKSLQGLAQKVSFSRLKDAVQALEKELSQEGLHQ